MAVPIFVALAAKQIVKKYGKKKAASFIRNKCVKELKDLLNIANLREKSMLKDAIRWLEGATDEQIMMLVDPVGGIIEAVGSAAGDVVVRTVSNIGKNPQNLLQSGYNPQTMIEAQQAVSQGIPFNTSILRPFGY